MIPTAKVRQVEQLLTTGDLSQRQISLRTGVSRAIIRSIALGERPDYEALQNLRAMCEADGISTGPFERCKGCGGMTQMPCRVCRIRKLRAQRLEAARRRRQQIREQELRRLLLLQRSIALGEIPPWQRPAA
jgi:hypothetical protein